MSHTKAITAQPNRSIAYRFFYACWWILESQWWVVIQHTDGLVKCIRAGSPTAMIVLTWAPIMCFPQWLIAPLLGFHIETLSIFIARMASMCIVRKLDGIVPLTRALGICHLITFGPVLTILLMSDFQSSSELFNYFVLSQIMVVSTCLFFDARDFYFYLQGHPYPCYIREGVTGGLLDCDDPRAHKEVTARSRIFGP